MKIFNLSSNIDLIIHGIEHFVVGKTFLQHEIQQLQKVFINEKKRQK